MQGNGPSGFAFLLIFFGPIGWIALLAMSMRTSFLTVRLPMAYAAPNVAVGLRRVRMAAALAAIAAGVGAIVLRDETMLLPLLAVVAGVAVVVAVVYAIRVSLNRVGIELDASNRWVTLRRVHPNFAGAAAERPARARVDRA